MTRTDAMRFLDELKTSTGVDVTAGLNVFLCQPPPLFDEEGEGFRFVIDPSGLSDEEEDKIANYAESRGFTVEDAWSDLGRFIKLWRGKHWFGVRWSSENSPLKQLEN